MNTELIHYFGYGSLVNRNTRPTDEPSWNARLAGWARAWEHRVEGDAGRPGCTSLTVTEDSRRGAGIDGVVVPLALSDLPELDAREAGYERIELPVSDFQLHAGPDNITSVHVYRSISAIPADAEHPILQSYVDCVMAGYQRQFGVGGLQRFLSTTRGWDGALLNDRTAPRYPRAVSLDAATLDGFDAQLASLIGA